MKTGINATKLAIAAFIVPYIFAFNPAMLLVDTNILQVVQIVITSLVGLFGIVSPEDVYCKMMHFFYKNGITGKIRHKTESCVWCWREADCA